MKLLSAFDVIGPNMIGPSSSHTAGAVRIALLAHKMVPCGIAAVHFVLYGSFASTYKGHGTDRALVAGILGFLPDDARIRDSFAHAQKAGIAISFALNYDEKDLHPNTADIHITDTEGNTIWIRGVSLGGGRAEIQGIDGVSIKITGEYSTIFIKHQDAPGMVAYIAGTLSKNNINIAFMQLYRKDKGANAYTIINADEEIPAAVALDLEQHRFIHSAILIQ